MIGRMLSQARAGLGSLRGFARGRPVLTTLAAVGVAGAYSLAVFTGGVFTGDWLSDNNVSAFIADAKKRFARARVHDDVQDVEWLEIYSNLHALEFGPVHIGEFSSGGGGITEVEGSIVFASQFGQFGVLEHEERLYPLDIRAPMNLQALRESELMNDPLFTISGFRVHDLLAVQTGRGAYDLYVSHERYMGDCFNFVVSRVGLAVDEAGTISVPDPEWEEFFVAEPCFPPKSEGWTYVGEQSGGRIVQYDEGSLLVSVGDFAFDGFNDVRRVSMDMTSHLGKIVKIDIETGAAEIFASGLRNEQGLLIDRQGRIWETEHGPQGGDELNLIVEGGNYGWPDVTYGVNYGLPRRDWPYNPVQGRHDGYLKPVYAFVPSIGISNIVQPDPEEFPLWEDHLVLASLRAQTIFLLRLEDDRVVYAEPIQLEHRFRDLIALEDGRLAVYTDDGHIIIIRNAERHRAPENAPDAPRDHFLVAGLSSIPMPETEEYGMGYQSPVNQGRRLYQDRCAHCHAINGDVNIGPPLNGVVGRDIGSVTGAAYSPALANADGVWTPRRLESFLTEPERHFDGTTMPPVNIPVDQHLNIIRYLDTLR